MGLRRHFEEWAEKSEGNAWFNSSYSEQHGYIDGATNVAWLGFKAGYEHRNKYPYNGDDASLVRDGIIPTQHPIVMDSRIHEVDESRQITTDDSFKYIELPAQHTDVAYCKRCLFGKESGFVHTCTDKPTQNPEGK